MSTHPIDGYALAGVLESGLPSEQLNRLTAALLDGVTTTDLESDTMLRTSLLDVLARWMRAPECPHERATGDGTCCSWEDLAMNLDLRGPNGMP